jgi:hypothetical protein
VGRFRRQRVVDVFSGTPILDEICFAQMSEMPGDARLSHAEDFLEFEDGEFFLLKEEQEAQPGFIGEQAQEFYD